MTEIKEVVGKTDEKRDALIKILFEGIKKEHEKDVFEVSEHTAYKDKYIDPLFETDTDAYNENSAAYWAMLDKTEQQAFRLGVYAAGLIFGETTKAERSEEE